jgi:hypothetical protein
VESHVAGVTIDNAGSLNVAVGGKRTLSAKVTAKSGAAGVSQAVTWSISGGEEAGTKIDPNTGVLTVNIAEVIGSKLKVRATSNVDKSKYAEAEVNVVDSITGVTVSPGPVSLFYGGKQKFTATVTGSNSPVQAVTWSIEGNDINPGTTIDSTGMLSIAFEQTRGSTLTVRATSTVNESKSATAQVTVKAWLISNQSELNEVVTVINSSGAGEYNITLAASFSATAVNFSAFSVARKTIFIEGKTSNQTITLTNTSNASLFTVSSGTKLVLDNVTLNGGGKAYSVVQVAGGELAMRPGSVIKGSTAANGGVYVAAGRLQILNGSEISGNTGSYGGGVYVAGGTFDMYGGKISGNYAGYNGGGVYVAGGKFTMEGGEISGNGAYKSGGGVEVYGGTFIMKSGKISGNTGNKGNSYGDFGGGVYVTYGTFTMSGGEISGNTLGYGYGGGVYVGRNGTFKKTGGTIYGSDGGDQKNTAYNDSYGHAVYVRVIDGLKRRNTTAGPGVNLDSGTADNWLVVNDY